MTRQKGVVNAKTVERYEAARKGLFLETGVPTIQPEVEKVLKKGVGEVDKEELYKSVRAVLLKRGMGEDGFDVIKCRAYAEKRGFIPAPGKMYGNSTIADMSKYFTSVITAHSHGGEPVEGMAPSPVVEEMEEEEAPPPKAKPGPKKSTKLTKNWPSGVTDARVTDPKIREILEDLSALSKKVDENYDSFATLVSAVSSLAQEVKDQGKKLEQYLRIPKDIPTKTRSNLRQVDEVPDAPMEKVASKDMVDSGDIDEENRQQYLQAKYCLADAIPNEQAAMEAVDMFENCIDINSIFSLLSETFDVPKTQVIKDFSGLSQDEVVAILIDTIG